MIKKQTRNIKRYDKTAKIAVLFAYVWHAEMVQAVKLTRPLWLRMGYNQRGSD